MRSLGERVEQKWEHNGHNVAVFVTERLGYCATSRKVAGSIPDGVIGIFH
jgi:hypothetical protein